MEIIEIGAVWATAEGTCSTRFRRWYAPWYALSSRRFVGSSRGIQQADVDGAELFPSVAARLASFAQRHQPPAQRGAVSQFDAKQLARDCSDT
jgi:inhibitor of KinA sporulation pathway (predicted exonuclease)